MTVHFAVPGPLEQRTGGYLYDREMVHGLRAMGHDLHVHEMAGAFPLPDDAARQSARRILARLESGGCLVIDGLALPAFTDALPRRPRRDSVVGLIHHPLALETGLTAAAARQLDALERRALAQLDGVICTSESTRQALVGRGYGGARVRVVSPGTRRAACPPRRPRSSTPALLCVATITPRKGHPELLRALVGLRHRRWRLECLGSVHRDAEQTRRVRAIIRRQRLGSRVRLRGECDERTLERAYRRASVFVLPSHHEGYGMALAEALIHGLPVVSTTAGAIPDTVPRGAGWLVPPGDTRALRRAIAAVLCQPRRGRQMAQAARRAGRQLRSWSQARYEFDRALTELAGLR